MRISCLSFSALQHAGKHMEDSIVASYSALLLGCLCQESPVSITSCHSLGALKSSWLALNQKGLYFLTVINKKYIKKKKIATNWSLYCSYLIQNNNLHKYSSIQVFCRCNFRWNGSLQFFSIFFVSLLQFSQVAVENTFFQVHSQILNWKSGFWLGRVLMLLLSLMMLSHSTSFGFKLWFFVLLGNKSSPRLLVSCKFSFRIFFSAFPRKAQSILRPSAFHDCPCDVIFLSSVHV